MNVQWEALASLLKPLLQFAISALWLVIGGLVLVFIAHTAWVLGMQNRLYKKRQPVAGWSRRFYPATLLLMSFIGLLVWWLTVWLDVME